MGRGNGFYEPFLHFCNHRTKLERFWKPVYFPKNINPLFCVFEHFGSVLAYFYKGAFFQYIEFWENYTDRRKWDMMFIFEISGIKANFPPFRPILWKNKEGGVSGP